MQLWLISKRIFAAFGWSTSKRIIPIYLDAGSFWEPTRVVTIVPDLRFAFSRDRRWQSLRLKA
jgi:hypothetical protein